MMMQVGEIGVLQNLHIRTDKNGLVAEIIKVYPPATMAHCLCGNEEEVHYFVEDVTGQSGSIDKHEIRKLTDPDAEQVIEREKEKVE